MDIKKIAELASNFETAVSPAVFSSRFERLMRIQPEKLVRHPSTRHALISEIDNLLDSGNKSPAVYDLMRLIKAALSMFDWAERARRNKRRGEELGAFEAAVSAINSVKMAYLKLKNNGY